MSRFEVDSFSPPADPEFLCSICRNVLDQPKETPCHHVFCEVCITKALAAKRKCPVCRSRCRSAQLKAVIPLVQNLLNKLTMKCVNFREGHEEISCKEIVKMEYYLEHLDTCQYSYIECPFSGCKRQILKKDWNHHKVSCDYRHVLCLQGCDLHYVWAHRLTHSCVQELKRINKELREENKRLTRKLEGIEKPAIEEDLHVNENDGAGPDTLNTDAGNNDRVESRVTSSSGGLWGDADAASDAGQAIQWERVDEIQEERDGGETEDDDDINPGDIYEDYDYDEYNESFDESDNYDDYGYDEDFDDDGDDDDDDDDNDEEDDGDDEPVEYDHEDYDSGDDNVQDDDSSRPANEDFTQNFNPSWSEASTQASSLDLDQHSRKRSLEQTLFVDFDPSKRPRLDMSTSGSSQNMSNTSTSDSLARRSARLQGLEAGPSLISNVEIPPSAAVLLDLHGNDDEDSEDDPSFNPS